MNYKKQHAAKRKTQALQNNNNNKDNDNVNDNIKDK